MERYDYRLAVKEDVKTAINENYTEQLNDFLKGNLDRDEFVETLNDDLFVSDSVTGNASGSYTFNAWDAEEYVCHNLDLLGEACEEFGGSVDVLKNGVECCDVTIRCYLLREAIEEALDELEDELSDEDDLKIKELISLVEKGGGSVHFTIPDNCPGDGWDGCAHEDGCYMFGNNHFEGEFYEYEDKDDELINWLDEIIEAVEYAVNKD